MVTIQRIIAEETQKCVAGLQRGDDDYLKIEEELMAAVKKRVMQANQAAGKGESKLQMPKYLNFGQIADILNATMCIKVITDGDNDMQLLGVFNGQTYDTDQNILYVAATKLNNTMGRRDLEEMIARLMLVCEHAEVNHDRDLVAVNNGVFNYKKKTLVPYTEDVVFLSKSSIDFNDNATLKTFADGWNVEDWMREIAVDDDVCALLWETVGAMLRPHVKWDKTVWLFSTAGNNGKGTFCELLRNLLGPKAYTSIPLSDFAKDFALGPLIGRQAIITDENDVGIYIDKLAVMKAVVTGDVFTINQKFKQPINYRFRGMMVQCLNEYPKVKDKSDSFYRRQVFVPFEKSFTGRENKNIKHVYLRDPEVLEYVMYKVLTTSYYELSEPDACKLALSDYKENNDPVRQFWMEFEDEFVWDLLPWPFLYDLYKVWYDMNYPRSQQLSRPAFITALKTIVQRESIVWGCDESNKKKHRIGTSMSKPELLIDQYGLKAWMSTSYAGRDPKKKCTLAVGDPLAESYPGLFRK